MIHDYPDRLSAVALDDELPAVAEQRRNSGLLKVVLALVGLSIALAVLLTQVDVRALYERLMPVTNAASSAPIRTKEQIALIAATQGDAERRLRQMYMNCEVLECREQCVPRRVDTLDVEGVIGLISGASISALPSLQKAGTH